MLRRKHLNSQERGTLGQQCKVRGLNVKGWSIPLGDIHVKIVRKIGKAVRGFGIFLLSTPLYARL